MYIYVWVTASSIYFYKSYNRLGISNYGDNVEEISKSPDSFMYLTHAQ